VYGSSCGRVTRQEPNTSRNGSCPSLVRVRTVGAGYGSAGSGHRTAPSSRTSYAVVVPGSSWSQTTKA
jgi:hypothetical protein